MSKGKLALGLDIGSSSIKMVMLKDSRKGYRLEAFGMASLPPEAIVDGSLMDSSVVVQAIEGILSTQKVRRKEVATGVSGRAVNIKKLSLPQMTRQELDESLRWDLENYIGSQADGLYADAEILAQGGDGQMDVLLVAAKKDIIMDYAMALGEAGLKAAVVDVDGIAAQNAVEMVHGFDDSSTVAIINIGASVTSINIVSQGVTAFTRDVTVGGNLITEEIQKDLGISYEEAEALKIGSRAGEEADAIVPHEVERVISQVAGQIAGEIQRSLDFYANPINGRFDKIYLSGGTSKIPSLQRIIADRSGAPVEVFNPFAGLHVDHKRFDPVYLEDVGPMAAVAVGLGLRRTDA